MTIYGRDMIPLYPQEWDPHPECPCGRPVAQNDHGEASDLCPKCLSLRDEAERDAYHEHRHDLWNDERVGRFPWPRK
jgi:hypothetical protein